jgi:hypothetical protein
MGRRPVLGQPGTEREKNRQGWVARRRAKMTAGSMDEVGRQVRADVPRSLPGLGKTGLSVVCETARQSATPWTDQGAFLSPRIPGVSGDTGP